MPKIAKPVSTSKIEKHIPLPSLRTPRGSHDLPTAAELRAMAVGDSFVAPFESRNAARAATQYVRQQEGHQFTSRTVGEQVRFWRVS